MPKCLRFHVAHGAKSSGDANMSTYSFPSRDTFRNALPGDRSRRGGVSSGQVIIHRLHRVFPILSLVCNHLILSGGGSASNDCALDMVDNIMVKKSVKKGRVPNIGVRDDEMVDPRDFRVRVRDKVGEVKRW
ncbi:hypothetical protein FRX31_028608 [Thalictrum thalictroides]|uniref:Uncharacterized protein n=1 Tax=Thalictrum thalictroides TaxID=46969 RepID=A0A7J6VC88_THATH|nr:hypothetical protein FRX31_028608 [Thalictrum thalictroides]